jgi:tetratricopeptide (TPR) repeat protein
MDSEPYPVVTHSFTRLPCTRRACQWELTAAIIVAQSDTSDNQAVERRILTLNPEPGVDHIHPVQIRDQSLIPTNGVDPANLASRVAARLPGLNQTFGQLHRLTRPNWYGSNMRLGSNRFVGRVPDLWAIHSGLSQYNFAMITGSNTGLVQVQGMGGIGKTLLAEEYTLRFSAAYPGGIFWLSAVRGESWSTQISRIAGHLELATANLNPDQVEGLLRGTLSNRGRYLWIVDDLPTDAGRDMLLQWSAPSADGVTLVTTRSIRMDGSGFVHRLDVLSYNEAFELLTNRRIPKSEAEHAAAQEILTQLGNHALAVDVARAAVEQLGYVDFLNRLRNPTKDATDFAAELVGELPTGHEPQIAATLLDSIERLDDDGLLFLRLAALLAPGPIPQILIKEVFSQLSTDIEIGIEQAIHGIQAATCEGLTERLSDTDDAISAHVLVSRTIRFRAGEPPPKLREATVTALIDGMSKAADIRNHPDLLPLVPHVRTLTEHLPEVSTAKLLSWLGLFNHERAAYREAEIDWRRTFECWKQLLGAEHPDTLTSMENLAGTLGAQGDHAGARAIQEEVLAVRRRLLGAKHPDTLTGMSNLAATLWTQGDHAGARAIQEEVLAVRRRLLGAEHPATLTGMSNLAETLRAQGDHAGARAIQEEVLAVRRRLLGAEHPDTLTSMENLAGTLGAQGDHAGARAIQEEVLAVRRRLLGAEHPDTLISMNNLARTLAYLDETDAARALIEEALPLAIGRYGMEPAISKVLLHAAAYLGVLLNRVQFENHGPARLGPENVSAIPCP